MTEPTMDGVSEAGQALLKGHGEKKNQCVACKNALARIHNEMSANLNALSCDREALALLVPGSAAWVGIESLSRPPWGSAKVKN